MQIVRIQMMNDPIQGAVYVAMGRVAGAALAKVASPVVVEDDELLLGPSRIDLKRHRAARVRYLGGEPSADLNEDLARSDGPPVCVALPPTPGGLMSLCRICASVVARGRTVFVVDLSPEAAGAFPQGPGPGRAISLNIADALLRKPPVVQWSKLETALAATLWKLWCRRSPVAFSRFCASGSMFHPQLANLGRYHAGLFPRRAGHGLLLSRFDELLLRQLSQEWLSPVKVFVNAINAESELDAWFSYTGDLYVAKRLNDWYRHTRGRIVERRNAHHPRPSEMTRWSFRWRAGSEAILEALPSVQAAPPVSIGGATAYDPDRVWACQFDARGTPYLSRFGTVSSGDSLE
ncbi:hypothetical protein WMF45_34820 [Sorangium sp. So ce448]|uniref:hypothetical protein n=1 Tax=Sorangium sp. So ce448 TaxID=3133314 RepID=UPI003F63920E